MKETLAEMKLNLRLGVGFPLSIGFNDLRFWIDRSNFMVDRDDTAVISFIHGDFPIFKASKEFEAISILGRHLYWTEVQCILMAGAGVKGRYISEFCNKQHLVFEGMQIGKWIYSVFESIKKSELWADILSSVSNESLRQALVNANDANYAIILSESEDWESDLPGRQSLLSLRDGFLEVFEVLPDFRFPDWRPYKKAVWDGPDSWGTQVAPRELGISTFTRGDDVTVYFN